MLDPNSFMCAGGEAGKGLQTQLKGFIFFTFLIQSDACTGDGGSPLMCPIGGRWYVVGLVAWGIGNILNLKVKLL